MDLKPPHHSLVGRFQILLPSDELAIRVRALTLTPTETPTEYIRHQMKQTGGNLPVFTNAAMQMIHAASKGIPRVMNQMCTQALYDTAAKNSEAIDESHVGRVLTDQEWQRGSAG
ncbi:hypothetical protein [Alicyclobacillus suci]|uniref:hypothetical protein n=1 Tax=Alicyclobacillus suci TaxID=2816080 RepID=UPI001A8F0513|nr:hypothetical protein [Alicyclobacillus suci]